MWWINNRHYVQISLCRFQWKSGECEIINFADIYTMYVYSCTFNNLTVCSAVDFMLMFIIKILYNTNFIVLLKKIKQIH